MSHNEALQEKITTAVDVLANGGVAGIPTDTLYGLAACAFDERAVLKIYELKGRPEGMALPLLLSDTSGLLQCAEEVPQSAWALAEHFWPGALTLVLRKSAAVPDLVTAGMNTVAVRVPDHPVPRAIAKALAAPITGTSANLSGSPGLTRAEDVQREFGERIDFVLDGGDAPGGVASTILDISGTEPRMLREGAVPWNRLIEVIKNSRDYLN